MIKIRCFLLINAYLEWYISVVLIEKYEFYKMLLGLLFVIVINFYYIKGDNFPSLLSTNATIAIIIDQEYLAEEYEKIKTSIEEVITTAKRDILKNGGVHVNYFSWTAINVKRDFSAVLSIAPCDRTWRLFKSAEEEKLLHMAISESDCPRLPPNEAVTIPIITKGEEVSQILLDLRTAKIYNWKSVVILHDYTLSRDMSTRIIKSITMQYDYIHMAPASISLINLNIYPNSQNVSYDLKSIFSTINPKKVGTNFLVIVSVDLIEIIMEIVKKLDLVNTRTQWLYLISDTNSQGHDVYRFKKLLNEGDNVAFIYNTTTFSETCKFGITCHTTEIINSFMHALSQAIADEYELAAQVSDEEWEAIRPTKLERRDYLLASIKKSLLKNGECGNCTSWGISTGETWGREYQQNSTGESNAEMLSVGNWRPIEGASMTDELFLHVAHGFRGKNLPMVTFHNPPWQIIKTNASGSVIELRGLVFDIISELSKNLNFTYSVEISKTNFSHKLEYANNSTNSLEIADIVTNNIPSDILEFIQNKSVALGACGFTISDIYKKNVNFTIPISIQTYTFLVARPRELSRALLFISPFTGDTWVCLAAAIISMGPILYYIHRFSPVYEYKGIPLRGGLSSIQNCMWYMYGALLQQGGMHLPYADSARIIVGAWWLVVLVMSTTYCGNLVAFLTFPKIDIPITTIDDLLTHRETVTWSILKDSFLEKELKRTSESRFKEIYEGRIDLPKSKKMLSLIEDGKHVYIDWKIRLQYIMKKQYLETDRCDLALGLDEFYDEQIAMVLPQDSPYIFRINEEIKKLHRVGLIQKWLKDYLPKKDRCWKNTHLIEVNNHTVNMDDMQGSFFVLFFGFLLSVLLIIGEKIWNKQAMKRKRKVIQPFTT